jgi:hypothetical protein
MTSHPRFTLEEARAAGERIGIDWDASPFDLEQFRKGMDIELEHGTRDPETNVTDDDVAMTATREASVGGDLYEILPTGYGIRVIIGHVRGKGLDAVLLARQVLSAFGEAPSPCPPWTKWQVRSAGPSRRTWRGGLRRHGAGPDRSLRRADHCQLRPSPAAATPPRRAAAADRRQGPAAAWPRKWLHRLYRGLVARRPAAALHRRARRKPRRPRHFLPENAIETALLAPGCDQALDTSDESRGPAHRWSRPR